MVQPARKQVGRRRSPSRVEENKPSPSPLTHAAEMGPLSKRLVCVFYLSTSRCRESIQWILRAAVHAVTKPLIVHMILTPMEKLGAWL